MACRVLRNTTSDESFHFYVLSEIDFMYSTKESEKNQLYASSVMENSPKMNKEKFRLQLAAKLFEHLR